jgi:hypothetical protein
MTSSLPDPAVTFAPLLAEIRALYGPGPIPLHRPVFAGPERRWLVDCIDSNFVSSVGARVTEFEEAGGGLHRGAVCGGDGQRHRGAARWPAPGGGDGGYRGQQARAAAFVTAHGGVRAGLRG